MSRPMTAQQMNNKAKAELLKLENGKAKYKQLCEYSEFLKDIRNFEGERFQQSMVGSLLKKKNYMDLSELVRKLKTPFITGVPHFDDQTKENASQKLMKVLAVIQQDVMSQLTELDTPFVYELPPKPVVSVPELQPVSEDIIRSELGRLSAFVLSALFALFTGIGVTPIRTECDNDPQKQSWIQDTITQMRNGESPMEKNTEIHQQFKHCRDGHGCPKCRALCAIMTIFRFGSNLDIQKQICRCVWHGSQFAVQAMRRLLILILGPTCALAQVVNDPESPHRAILVQILTEMNVQETCDNQLLRLEEDDQNRKLELEKFKQYAEVERLADIAFRKADLAENERGYDISKI